MGNDNKRKGAGILLFHFPLVREMQPRSRAAPSVPVREMQPPMRDYVCGWNGFSFPACTRDATFNIWPYLSLCCFHFPLVREMQRGLYNRTPPADFFISRLYARCNHRAHRLANEGLHFSFPACTRDATCRMTYASLNDIFSFPACTRDATVWEKGNKTCGGTELFARTSFQPTSQPQFSLGIVDVWCRFAQAGTTEITSILSLSHKPRTV